MQPLLQLVSFSRERLGYVRRDSLTVHWLTGVGVYYTVGMYVGRHAAKRSFPRGGGSDGGGQCGSGSGGGGNMPVVKKMR